MKKVFSVRYDYVETNGNNDLPYLPKKMMVAENMVEAATIAERNAPDNQFVALIDFEGEVIQ